MKNSKMKLARRRAARRGYTIIELMFSLVIFLFCIVALLNALSDSMYHYTVQADYAIMQMDARRALETIARDVRMAGHIEDPSSGIEYPYTFTNGQPRADLPSPRCTTRRRSMSRELARPSATTARYPTRCP